MLNKKKSLVILRGLYPRASRTVCSLWRCVPPVLPNLSTSVKSPTVGRFSLLLSHPVLFAELSPHLQQLSYEELHFTPLPQCLLAIIYKKMMRLHI